MKNLINKITSSLFLVAILMFMSVPVFGATFTDFISGNNKLSQSAYDPGPGYKGVFIQSRLIDLSSQDFNEGSGVTNGTILQVFKIPPNSVITSIGLRILTGALITGTSIEVGDGADPNGWLTGVTIVTAAPSGASIWNVGDRTVLNDGKGVYMASGAGASPYVGPDTLDVTFNLDYTTMVGNKGETSGVTPTFEIWAVMHKNPTY